MSVYALRFHVKYTPVIKLFYQVRKQFFSPEQICHGMKAFQASHFRPLISGLELTDVHEEFFL